MNNSFTVTSLNQYIKNKFDTDFNLKGIRLEGEILNLKEYPSGHIYFSLIDENSSIKAVMFAQYRRFIDSKIKNGDKVNALGYVSVYPQRGEYQFYCEAIEQLGLGNKLIELEKLKRKLALEGLFDESHKREIDRYKTNVGVICAPNSAALADIRKNLIRRYPLVHIYEFLATVQGEGAVKSLINAINLASQENIDVLIIGRGGGSNEDLSAFNDETLVRLIYNFKVPVISAVGHEIDFTLIDFVSDKRASTPTGACELAVMDKNDIYQNLDLIESSLDDMINNLIISTKHNLDNLTNRKIYLSANEIYKNKIAKIEEINHILDIKMNNILSEQKDKLNYLSSHLEMISPDKTLKRGYSLALNSNNKIIKSIEDVNINEEISIRFSDGLIKSIVTRKE